MEYMTNQTDLARAVGFLSRAYDKSAFAPILANVLATVQRDGLELLVTDLDLYATARCPVINAAKTKAGKATFPFRPFADAVKAIPKGALVEIKTVENKVIFCAGRARFTFTTLPVEDFPLKKDLKPEYSFEIPADDLAGALEKTAHAISTEVTRYYLNGVCFDLKKGKMKLIATDGHQMALVDLDVTTPKGQGDKMVIVPAAALKAFRPVLKKADLVKVVFSGNNMILDVPPYFNLTAILVDGTFPDYTRVVPNLDNCQTTLRFNAGELAAVAARIGKLGNGSGAIKLDLELNEISATDGEGNKAVEGVDWHRDGPAFTVGYNFRYLVDTMKSMDGEVVMHLSTPKDPALFLLPDSPDSAYVLMPMRV